MSSAFFQVTRVRTFYYSVYRLLYYTALLFASTRLRENGIGFTAVLHREGVCLEKKSVHRCEGDIYDVYYLWLRCMRLVSWKIHRLSSYKCERTILFNV